MMTSDGNNGHILYASADFKDEDWDNPSSVARLVVDGGLGICKVCGAGEIELSIPCDDFLKQKNERNKI